MRRKLIAVVLLLVLLLQVLSTTIYAITDEITQNNNMEEKKTEEQVTTIKEEQKEEENIQHRVLGLNPETGEIDVPDPELKRKLDSNYDDVVTKEEAESITSLYLDDITDLTGIEYAINLTRLDVDAKKGETIANLALIANLTKLKNLDISMDANNIEVDFSIFGNLVNLEELDIKYIGKVKNIETLNTLTKLRYIYIYFDTIDSISDIEKIQDIEGRTNNVVLALGLNEEVNTQEQVQALHEKIKDVQVASFKFNRIVETMDLGDISVGTEKTIGFAEFPVLAYLSQENCKVSAWYRNIEEIFNYSDKIEIDMENSNISIKTDSISTKNDIELQVNCNVGVNILFVIHLKYNVVFQGEKTEVEIPDNTLKQYLLENYDIDNDEKITEFDLKNITDLSNMYERISNLTGLEKATNLKKLLINSDRESAITDLTPLTFMTNLEELKLEDIDVNANWNVLSNLTNLKKLDLFNVSDGYNMVALKDISFLGTLTNLEELHVWVNTFDKSISYNVLANLVNLKKLTLGGLYTNYDEEKEYKDISFLQNLTKLEDLDISNVLADDLDFIENFNDLTYLYIKDSKIKKLDLNKTNGKISRLEVSNIDEIVNGEAINNCEAISFRFGLNRIDDLAQFAKINEGKMSYLDLDFNGLVLNSNEEVEEFKAYIENIKIDKVSVNGLYQKVDLGEVIAKQEKTYSLKDISSLLDYFLAENSKIRSYHSYYFSYDTDYNDYNPGIISINDNDKTITITPEYKKVEENEDESINSHVVSVYASSSTIIGIKLAYKVVSPGDIEEEIEFNNDVLKNYLLENYDIDENGKITEFDIKNITSITIRNLNDLTGIEKLTYLRILTVYGQFTDLTPINALENLEWLNLNCSKLENIASLAFLPKLTTFNIGRDNYNIPYDGVEIDFARIEGMTNLKSMSFSCVKSVQNTEKINNLEKLETLNVTFTNVEGIKDFDKIENRENLSLSLRYSAPNNKPCTLEESIDFANMISNMKLKNYNLEAFLFDMELSDLYLGEEKVIKFEDLFPVVKSYMENKGKIHIYYEDYNNTNEVIVDNEKREIRLLYNDIKSSILYMNFSTGDGGSVLNNLNIKFNVEPRGNKEEVVEIPDENLRQHLTENYDIDKDGLLTDYELKCITNARYLYNVSDLTGLEHATNLKSLEISFDEDADLSLLSSLPKLEILDVGGIYDNNTLAQIARLKTLKELEINFYNSNYTFDLNLIFNNLNNLEKLCIYNYEVDTLNGVQKLGNLNNLTIFYPKDKDLSYLKNCTNLKTLELRDVREDLNINAINQIDKLEDLTLKYYSINQIKNLSNIKNNLNRLCISTLYRNDEVATKDEQLSFINEINNVTVENLELDIDVTQNALNVKVNTNTVFSLEQISPILKEILTPNTKLNRMFGNSTENFYYMYNEAKNIYDYNKNTHELTVNATNAGKYGFEISLYSRPNGIYIYNNQVVYVDEGSKDEVNIPDNNLKAKLLRECDIDEDGIISEFDLNNLYELYIDDMGITDLTGLEYAKNLTTLSACKNQIRSIEPLMNCEKLERANLENNYITDITCMTNRKFNLAIAIGLMGNYIDFTNNSENFRVLKAEVAKDYGKSEEGLGYEEMITYFAGLQYHGTPEEVNREVIFGDSRIKDKIISLGLDANNDGKLTRKELMPVIDTSFITGWSYYLINGKEVNKLKLDLSNMGITDLTGLEYLTGLCELDLSYNNLTNIEPLKYLNGLTKLNLSHNKIKDLSALSNCAVANLDLTDLDFSYNEITSIEPLNNWIRLNNCIIEGWHDIDPPVRLIFLNLSNNKISDISGVENWRALLNLDLSNNEITNISNLKNYDFYVYSEDDIKEWDKTLLEYAGTNYKLEINLSNNDIDENSDEAKEVVNLFKNKKAEVLLKAKDLVIEDEESDVKIEATTEELPSNTKLNVEKIEDEEEKEEVKDVLGEDTVKFEIFDIVLTRNNLPIEPTGKVLIFIPIPEGYDKDNIVCYRIDDDGTKVEYEVTIMGNFAVIETDHFSRYVILEGNKYSLGDVNKDGKINALDATLILKYVAKKKELTEDQLKLADVTKDGKVNALDAVKILKYVAKKITEF